ncbi:MAG TPA: hypothetical protein VI451_11880 [Anaerolineales bacterium]|nr:hypothetical protein [Anaerolineales bacterium]
MTNANFSHLISKRNPETHEQHRRQMFWQVFFPLGVGVILMLAVCVLPVAAVTQGGEVRRWADISLIWLILPAMLFSLIPLALLAGSVYGLVRLFQILPGWMFRLQGIFDRIRGIVRQYADKAVEPVIQVQSFTARIQAAIPKRKTSPQKTSETSEV